MCFWYWGVNPLPLSYTPSHFKILRQGLFKLLRLAFNLNPLTSAPQVAVMHHHAWQVVEIRVKQTILFDVVVLIQLVEGLNRPQTLTHPRKKQFCQ